jgi:hypothetical protein
MVHSKYMTIYMEEIEFMHPLAGVVRLQFNMLHSGMPGVSTDIMQQPVVETIQCCSFMICGVLCALLNNLSPGHCRCTFLHASAHRMTQMCKQHP